MLSILYDDAAVMVVDKPVGVPAARRVAGLESVADRLAAEFPALAGLPDSGLVHRLDNDTSGALLVAKTPEAQAALRRQFDAGTVYKEYDALVLGHPKSRGEITLPIRHDPRSAKRMRCGVAGAAGQAAHTEWTARQVYPVSKLGATGYSWLQILIRTGVRHQIRVHLANEGHPLVGDRLYQNRRQRDCDRLGLDHHLLHAQRIGFLHPVTLQEIRCEAPLPTAFAATLKTLDEMGKRR